MIICPKIQRLLEWFWCPIKPIRCSKQTMNTYYTIWFDFRACTEMISGFFFPTINLLIRWFNPQNLTKTHGVRIDMLPRSAIASITSNPWQTGPSFLSLLHFMMIYFVMTGSSLKSILHEGQPSWITRGTRYLGQKKKKTIPNQI